MSVPPLDTIKSCQPNPLNQNCDFRGTRLHCFLPPQRRLAYVLFIRFPAHLSVHQSIPSGWTERATHLTSGQLSKQASPFTLTPRGRKTIDNSLPRVNLCTFGIDPEHWWHTGLSLEPGWIHNTENAREGMGGGIYFLKGEAIKKIKEKKMLCHIKIKNPSYYLKVGQGCN